MRSLVVDDDTLSARILAGLLCRYGPCHAEYRADAALETLRQSHHGSRRFDLICLDILMPGMDGQELLRRIRAWEDEQGLGDGQGSRILMVSAEGDADTVLKAFAGRCDGFLVKPVRSNELLRHLTDLGLIGQGTARYVAG